MKTAVETLPASIRWWALASGVAGLVADAFLVLFYVTAKPWTGAVNDGWFGRANDLLVVGQYLALVPVVLGLGQLMSGDARARRWTRISVAACIAVLVLQVLLLTRVLGFAIQVIPVSLSVIVTMFWAGAISSAGARTRTLPRSAIRLGRVFRIGPPIAVAVFAVGFVVSLVADISWAWVAGGGLASVIWFLFPLWTALLALGPVPARIGQVR
jgi:hypothetical protein